MTSHSRIVRRVPSGFFGWPLVRRRCARRRRSNSILYWAATRLHQNASGHKLQSGTCAGSDGRSGFARAIGESNAKTATSDHRTTLDIISSSNPEAKPSIARTWPELMLPSYAISRRLCGRSRKCSFIQSTRDEARAAGQNENRSFIWASSPLLSLMSGLHIPVLMAVPGVSAMFRQGD